MTKYTIEAVRRIYLRADVEANSREEAFEIVDREFIDDDFEVTNSDFTFTSVI